MPRSTVAFSRIVNGTSWSRSPAGIQLTHIVPRGGKRVNVTARVDMSRLADTNEFVDIHERMHHRHDLPRRRLAVRPLAFDEAMD